MKTMYFKTNHNIVLTVGPMFLKPKDLENMTVNGLVSLLTNTSSNIARSPHDHAMELLRSTCHLGPQSNHLLAWPLPTLIHATNYMTVTIIIQAVSAVGVDPLLKISLRRCRYGIR